MKIVGLASIITLRPLIEEYCDCMLLCQYLLGIHRDDVMNMCMFACYVFSPLQTEHTGEVTVNQDSAFYVLNPGGDLLKTQSVFATWFNTQEGWEGVVGRPPTDTEYTSALQSKDLYV